MLKLYQTCSQIAAPLIFVYLIARLLSGKEERSRFSERRGLCSIVRPEGKLLWVHAASVGESLSMLPLIDHLIDKNKTLNILVTTGTVSSSQILAQRLPQRTFHQYIPVDLLKYVKRFLNYWKPDGVLWTESEFWPNLISETQRRNIPLALVNGRISPKSFTGWKRAHGLISELLKNFEICLGQTIDDTEKLRDLGAVNCKCVGNLKFAAPALPHDQIELKKLQRSINSRPCWLAVSTHPGEEELIVKAHQTLKINFTSILTIIVPRHPQRGVDIEAFIEKEAMLNVSRRSLNNPITDKTEIYLADTIGELGLLFRATKIAFMGKSLVPLGGQNPLEALKLRCAVLHGPHMTNFKEITEEMTNLRCSITIENYSELADHVSNLLTNEKECAEMINRGISYIDSKSKVIENITLQIDPIINQNNVVL